MSKSPARKIAKDLEALLEDVVAAVKDAGGELSDETREVLADATLALADAAQSLAREAKQRSAPIARSAAEEIKSHPIATAATLAIAAATVAGVLTSRRKHLNA